MTKMISKKKLMEGTIEEKVLYLRTPYNRLNPLHEAEMLQEIMDTVPEVKTQRDLAKYLNWPESTISIHIKILKHLDPAIKKHLNETVETPTAYTLYAISKLPKPEQLAAYDART